MSTIAADTALAPAAAARPGERMRRAARRWRYASNVGAAILSAVLLVWTLTPIYNIVMVSFEAEGDVLKANLGLVVTINDYRRKGVTVAGEDATVLASLGIQTVGTDRKSVV